MLKTQVKLKMKNLLLSGAQCKILLSAKVKIFQNACEKLNQMTLHCWTTFLCIRNKLTLLNFCIATVCDDFLIFLSKSGLDFVNSSEEKNKIFRQKHEFFYLITHEIVSNFTEKLCLSSRSKSTCTTTDAIA